MKLCRIAEQVAPSGESPSRRVLALADWVYRNKGFHENDRYFVLPRLRATPMQVLAGGGDCADKSRLLTALLREVGIASTMLMCFDPRSGAPTHTVVEAHIENGSYMVVDPVYRLWFPRPNGQGYYDLLDLRNDPNILELRLDELLAVAPRRNPLWSYNRESAVYDHAASINWNKNAFTRLLHDQIRVGSGDGVYRFPRPLVLEEPKLFVAAALTGMGCVCFASTVIVRRSKRRRESPKVLRSEFACGP
ncbi:MAG: transglutaminase-like domain-containing protein [Phycisphaerales bacterium]|nr:transglutaminase-like domain-containing protein [Phycisphaerales bacterium]